VIRRHEGGGQISQETPFMEELKAKRAELLAQADAITDAAIAEKRALTADEKVQHDELVSAARGVRDLMDTRAARDAEAAAELPELRAAVIATEGSEREERSKAPATPRQPELRPVYGERSEHSFFIDLAHARANGDEDARQRQAQNRAYAADDMQKRDLGNVSNKGAEAIVPLFLQDRFEKGRVAKAITSGLTNQNALPVQGDTITIPYQTGNAAVASLAQADPLNTLQETNIALDAATSSVLEIGGTQDLSNYLVDRGTLGASVDLIVANHLSDLLARDENERVIAAVVAGASYTVTNTTSTPALVTDFKRIADATQQIHAGNLQAPTGIVVHPRRFAYWMSSVDNQNRPLLLPMAVALNPLASTSGDGSPVAQGYTGYAIHGMPVYVDATITTTDGAGTNQDLILVADWKQQYTWLGPIMVDLDRSIMFKQSGVTVRARRYFATMVAHRAQGFAKITGTGFVPPSFA
jgi:HK97 family phage major capsid protein